MKRSYSLAAKKSRKVKEREEKAKPDKEKRHKSRAAEI